MKENKKKLGKNAEMELDEAQIENVSGGEVTAGGLVSSNVGVTGLEINPNVNVGDIKSNIGIVNVETNTAQVVMTTSGDSNTVQNTGSISISK